MSGEEENDKAAAAEPGLTSPPFADSVTVGTEVVSPRGADDEDDDIALSERIMAENNEDEDEEEGDMDEFIVIDDED